LDKDHWENILLVVPPSENKERWLGMVIITREIQNNFVELNLTRDDDHPSLTFLIFLVGTTSKILSRVQTSREIL